SGSRDTVAYVSEGDGTWTRVTGRCSPNFGSSLAVADLNRDGRPDFVASSDSWEFKGLLNLGQADGTWTEAAIPGLRPAALSRAVATADFDGDGRPDLAVGFVTHEGRGDRAGGGVLLKRA